MKHQKDVLPPGEEERARSLGRQLKLGELAGRVSGVHGRMTATNNLIAEITTGPPPILNVWVSLKDLKGDPNPALRQAAQIIKKLRQSGGRFWDDPQVLEVLSTRVGEVLAQVSTCCSSGKWLITGPGPILSALYAVVLGQSRGDNNNDLRHLLESGHVDKVFPEGEGFVVRGQFSAGFFVPKEVEMIRL